MSSAVSLAPLWAFASVASLVLLIGWRMQRIQNRIADRLDSQSPGGKLSAASSLIRRWRFQSSAPPKAVDEPEIATALDRQLQMAGYASRNAAANFRALRVALCLTPLAAGIGMQYATQLPSPLILLTSVSAAIAGWSVPGAALRGAVRRRQAALKRCLPDFLDLMVTCVESGLSLYGATNYVTSEVATAHPMLASELHRIQHELNVGGTPDGALRHLAERSGVDAISSLATAIQHSIQYGSGVADALRCHADSLRFEREQIAEERAQRASVKILAPTMLFIFPVTFVVLAGPAVMELANTFNAARPKPAAAAEE